MTVAETQAVLRSMQKRVQVEEIKKKLKDAADQYRCAANALEDGLAILQKGCEHVWGRKECVNRDREPLEKAEYLHECVVCGFRQDCE